MQARSRGLNPFGVSAIQHKAVVGQVRSTSVVLHHPPLCCINPRCVASEAARINQTTNCERIQEIVRGCKNGHGKKKVCCSVLQRVAACCSVLQCVAACCSGLQMCCGKFEDVLQICCKCVAEPPAEGSKKQREAAKTDLKKKICCSVLQLCCNCSADMLQM